jgi:hypothetical protein
MVEVPDVDFCCLCCGRRNNFLSYYKVLPFFLRSLCCSMLVCDDCQENRGRCIICRQDIYVCCANKSTIGTKEWIKEFKTYAKFHAAAFNQWDFIIPFIANVNMKWRTVANIVDNPGYDARSFQELSERYQNFVGDCVTKPRLFYILNSAVMRSFRVFTFKSTGNILNFVEIAKFSKHNTSQAAFLNQNQFGFITMFLKKISFENTVSCKRTGDDYCVLSYSTEFRKHIFRMLMKMCLSKKVLSL